MAPEPSKGPALIALMRRYKWSKAVILTSTDGVFIVSGIELMKQLQAAEVKVLKPPAFESGLNDDLTGVDVGEIKRSGIR